MLRWRKFADPTGAAGFNSCEVSRLRGPPKIRGLFVHAKARPLMLDAPCVWETRLGPSDSPKPRLPEVAPNARHHRTKEKVATLRCTLASW